MRKKRGFMKFVNSEINEVNSVSNTFNIRIKLRMVLTRESDMGIRWVKVSLKII